MGNLPCGEICVGIHPVGICPVGNWPGTVSHFVSHDETGAGRALVVLDRADPPAPDTHPVQEGVPHGLVAPVVSAHVHHQVVLVIGIVIDVLNQYMSNFIIICTRADMPAWYCTLVLVGHNDSPHSKCRVCASKSRR